MTGPAAPPKAPHGPELSPVARLLGPLRVTGAFWYRLHGFGVRICPDWIVSPLLAAFTGVFFLTLGRIRRALAANLVPVLGPCSWRRSQRRSLRSMHQFAWCLTERYESLCAGVEMSFTTSGQEHWQGVVAAPGGFILATAHMGNWELGAAVGSDHGGRRVHLVREEEGDPRAQEYIRGLIQERFGERYVTHFAAADPALGLRLRGCLQEGDIVALQADRPRAGGTTLDTSLFGRPFQLPRGLLALARTTGVPILPAFTLRTGRRRYEIRFAAPIRVEPSGDRLAAEARAAGELARALEQVIRSHPHQWFCFHRLWPGSSR